LILCDTSPLIALIDRADRNHLRCKNVLPILSKPLITTWPCLSEAMYNLGKYGGWPAQKALWNLLQARVLILHNSTEKEQTRMQQLMAQYHDRPMDLADASLVVCAEMLNQKRIFTLDSDFYIYRFLNSEAFEVLP
jgi:uncharacterized protein